LYVQFSRNTNKKRLEKTKLWDNFNL
jgi:hypothetical protein